MPSGDASPKPLRVAVLGAGHLGQALLAGLSGPATEGLVELTATARTRLNLGSRVRVLPLAEEPSANEHAAAWADVCLIAVRPSQTIGLLRQIGSSCRRGSTVVPLAIGLRLHQIQASLPNTIRSARAMPNTPAELRQGVIGFSQRGQGDNSDARWVLELLGTVVDVPDDQLDLLSAVSGAGPAYVYYLITQWVKATQRLGFDETTSTLLVEQTFAGAARLLEARTSSPVDLLTEVASAGGATERAIAVLEGEGIADAAEAAMRAAFQRTVEIGRHVRADRSGALDPGMTRHEEQSQ